MEEIEVSSLVTGTLIIKKKPDTSRFFFTGRSAIIIHKTSLLMIIGYLYKVGIITRQDLLDSFQEDVV